MLIGVLSSLFPAQDRILGCFGDPELDNFLGGDLDSRSGCGVPSHPSLSIHQDQFAKTWDREGAKAVGALVAQRAKEKGIASVVFDRGGYVYHGKIKALADAAREAGLLF